MSTVLQNAATATGNGANLPISGKATAAFQVTGTFVATVTFEGTVDGATWAALQAVNLADGSVATTASAAGIYMTSVAGLNLVRARISAFTSGSVTVTAGLADMGGGLSLADVDVAGAEATTIADGANVALGAVADAAVTTDANGTVSAKLRGLIKLLVDQITVKLAAGTQLIGKVSIDQVTANANEVVLKAGSAVIGATTDNGPAWTSAYLYTASADATGNVAVTAAPTAGQKIVVDDIIVSTDTAMYVIFEDETAATPLIKIFLPANGSAQITPRGRIKLPVADKKLMIDTSAAGNIAVTCCYHSEA